MCNCNNTTTTTATCKKCTDTGCKVLISSDCVNNFTEDLPCSNILKGQTLTETIVKLDEYICTKFNSIPNFFEIINAGTTGAGIYKGANMLGKKELRRLVDSNLINIVEGVNEITISVDEVALAAFIANISTADGSETKIEQGANIAIQGIGTDDDPYVINAVIPPSTFLTNTPVVLASGKTLGKYTNGQTILSAGKTFEEVLKDIALEYLNPVFTLFEMVQASLIEVGDVLSGSKTFNWATTNNNNIQQNSLEILDVTANASIGTALTNDGSQNISIGTIVNTSPITRNWVIRGLNTNSVVFTSNNYTVNSIYPIFFGVSNSVPFAGQSLINGGTKEVVQSNGTLNITFDASGQYLWFAHPATNTTKTKWFVNALNNGNIGSVSDLFGVPTTIPINSQGTLWNGIEYKVYISNYVTTTNGIMELQN